LQAKIAEIPTHQQLVILAARQGARMLRAQVAGRMTPRFLQIHTLTDGLTACCSGAW